MTEREPEWTDEDRDWHLALLAEQAETCRGCGHPLDECRDPSSAGKWRVVSSQCEACRVLEADADNQHEAAARIRGRYTVAVRS